MASAISGTPGGASEVDAYGRELQQLVDDALEESRALARLARDDYSWQPHNISSTRASVRNAGERIEEVCASLRQQLENPPRTPIYLPNLASPATPSGGMAGVLASEYSSLREEMLQTKSAAEKSSRVSPRARSGATILLHREKAQN